MQTLDSSNFTLSAALPISAYSLTPSQLHHQMLLHRHTAHELLRVRAGTLTLLLGGQQHLLKENDVFLIHPGAYHALHPTADCTYECINFDATLLLQPENSSHTYLSRLINQTVLLNAQINKAEAKTQALCQQLLDSVFVDNAVGYELEAQGLVLQLLGRMIAQGEYVHCQPASAHTQKTMAAIDRVLTCIRENYTQPLSLTDLSETAELSPNYFCRYFKRLAGCAPVDYLINYRILISEDLLRTTQRPIAEIALACGFNDASHYIKFFRRKKGITPRQYRIQSMDEAQAPSRKRSRTTAQH